jgi:nucleoside-diphosphate-sugar epimerase
VIGAAGALGQRVLAQLVADGDVRRAVALDARPLTAGHAKIEAHLVDVNGEDVRPFLAGADTVVHLPLEGNGRARRGAASPVVEATRRVTAAAAEEGVDHVVALSSATVYGAWPNNPLPLTEEAPLRPNPGFAFAVERAQAEYVLTEWAAAREGRVAGVVRPCTSLGAQTAAVASALAASSGIHRPEEEPPWQFLHVDDLAAAVEAVRRARLDGPVNAAPDGWVAGDTVRRLDGRTSTLSFPRPVARSLARLRWRFQRGPIPAGLEPLTLHPWLVANDRLKAAGWRPRYTNEQAFVAGTQARWWTMLTPKRKQELALGGVGLLVTTATAGSVAGLRRALSGARRA